VTAQGVIATGTTSIGTGCGTVGSVTGGRTTGSFTAGQTSCSPVINLPTAPNGWWCDAKDVTNGINFTQINKSTASCVVSATVTNGDVIVFHAEAY
jgi:hypothetical protein